MAIDPDELAALGRGARRLGLEVAEPVLQGLLRFLDMLDKWNRAMNLTAVARADMLTRHLLDSLSIAEYLIGNRVIDVGTGAGLPGLPLALVVPGRHFTLLDSRDKRIRFVRQAVQELGLSNVEVVSGRAGDHRPESGYDTVLARAFAPLPEFLEAASHLVGPAGRFLAMGGHISDTDLARIPSNRYGIEQVTPLAVPGLDAARHLAIITPRRSQGDGASTPSESGKK